MFNIEGPELLSRRHAQDDGNANHRRSVMGWPRREGLGTKVSSRPQIYSTAQESSAVLGYGHIIESGGTQMEASDIPNLIEMGRMLTLCCMVPGFTVVVG